MASQNKQPITGQGATDAGARPGNNDVILVDNALGLYAVADGTGSKYGSSTASNMAIEILREEVRKSEIRLLNTVRTPDRRRLIGDVIQRAFQKASAKIFELGNNNDSLKGMNTSLICFKSLGFEGVIGHVGFCRSYLLKSGQIVELTEPHTYTNELRDHGIDIQTDVSRQKFRKVLSRSVGIGPGVITDIVPVNLPPQSKFVLCSQHISQVLSEKSILRACMGFGSNSAQALIDEALRSKSTGNVSAIVLTSGMNQDDAPTISTDEKVKFLADCFMFKNLSFPEIARLLDFVDEVSFGKGQRIFTEGDRGEEFFLIVSGEVAVFKGTTELTRLGPGSPFGEQSLVHDPVRSASLVAVEPCQLLRITRREFDRLRHTRPILACNVMYHLLTHLSERIRSLSEQYYQD
jgi:PPM family protein phosphatase